MGDPLADWWRHEIVIERLASTGAYGDLFDAPAIVHGAVDDTRRLVLDATGNQVISETTVALPWSVADVPPRSLVTLPAAFGGRRTRVIAVKRADGGGQPTPDHLELNLQ